MNLRRETYLSGDYAHIVTHLTSDLTSLPLSCKQNKLREYILTFNHLQF